jgi:predicted RNA-binding protein with PUA-like domain
MTIGDRTRCCAHTVIDWIAMAMQRGNPYAQYYEEHKDEIEVPRWAHLQIEEMFECVAPPSVEKMKEKLQKEKP